MKLDTKSPNIERSTELQETQLGIGDLSILLDIIRNRLYSCAEKAIVQEIVSNAIDANKEANNAHLPVEIQLPSSLDSTFYVRDYGPSITPERMHNVFLKYCASTKRETNDQHGYFGIGSKTPFSYSDSFTIESITTENGKNIKRIYTCYIDETKIGKLATLLEQETDEPQGVKIALDVRPKDFDAFNRWVKEIWQWQEPRPNVVGRQFAWPEHKLFLDGKDWKLFSNLNTWASGYTTVLLGSIPYKLNTRYFNINEMTHQQRSILNHNLLIQFPIGALSVNASREDIDYDEETIAKIKNKIIEIAEDVKKEFLKSVHDCTTYLAACQQYAKMMSKYGLFIGTTGVEWRGHLIDYTHISLSRKNYDFAAVNGFTFTSYLRRSKLWRISFADDAILCIDDTDTTYPSKPRINTLAIKNPGKQIDVIKFEHDDPKIVQKTMDYYEKKYKLSLLNPIYLSTIDKTTIKASGGTSGIKQTRVYQFNPVSWRKYDRWKQTDKDLTNDSGIYVTYRRGTAYDSKGQPIHRSDLKDFATRLKTEIYAIPDRYQKQIGARWTRLEDKIEEQKQNILKDQELVDAAENICLLAYSAIHRLGTCIFITRSTDDKYTATSALKQLKSDSAWRLYIELSIKIWNIKVDKTAQISDLLSWEQIAKKCKNKPKDNLKTLQERCEKLYPLMQYVNTINVSGDAVKDLVQYINSK